ncbi:MAG: hypothetical protein Q9216_005309 [Gyalolechia sp. 2 TL-2023]
MIGSMTDPVKSRQAHTANRPTSSKDWEKHRASIERLYVEEEKSLPTVIDELKSDHGFFATERQYKRRISAWRLDKNVKGEEMRAIIATEATRLLQGKESTFYVRDRQVDPMKIERFARRKRIDRTTYNGYTSSSLPADVRCITPPPGTIMTSNSVPSFAALSAGHCDTNNADTMDVPQTHTQPSTFETKSPLSKASQTSAEAPHSNGAASLDRTPSDVYQDQLYPPSVAMASPPQPPQQRLASENSTSIRRNSALQDRLQAAQRGRVTRQSSPTDLAHEQPSSGLGSEYRLSNSTSRSLVWSDSVAPIREQQKSESDSPALVEHQPKPDDFITPRTTSPKALNFDHEEAKRDVQRSLSNQSERQEQNSHPRDSTFESWDHFVFTVRELKYPTCRTPAFENSF